MKQKKTLEKQLDRIERLLVAHRDTPEEKEAARLRTVWFLSEAMYFEPFRERMATQERPTGVS